MTDMNHAPVCGIFCGECPFLGDQCAGCGAVAGKPFWTADMPGGICPLHDCCRNRKELEHCGLCGDFPCRTFLDLRDPNMSDDEFQASLEARKNNLAERREIGTAKWLASVASRPKPGGDE